MAAAIVSTFFAMTGKRVNESVSVVSFPASSEGAVDEEHNPLITSDALCAALAAHVKAYLHMRTTYDADYRGNPEIEVGDVIGLQTPYRDCVNALILTDEITFDGSLHGKLKVKALI